MKRRVGMTELRILENDIPVMAKVLVGLFNSGDRVLLRDLRKQMIEILGYDVSVNKTSLLLRSFGFMTMRSPGYPRKPNYIIPDEKLLLELKNKYQVMV